jgi:predicted HAD superfamily hydrolase
MSPLNSEVLQQLQLNYQVAGMFMDIISPTLKKQIIECRDVNLAALLMKNYESVQAACSLHTSSGL